MQLDIGSEQGEEVLARMDQDRKLTHPLAHHLMDRLPADHPFKQDQQRLVDRLVELLTGDINEEAIEEAVWLRERIVSVYLY